MTALAVIVLAVWVVGIVIIAAGFAAFGRDDPAVDMAFTVDPVRAAVAVSLLTVFWPSAVIAAGLSWLTNRGRR